MSCVHVLCLVTLLCAAAWAKPFLRVDIRNGAKVPPQFSVTGKTVPGSAVLIQVSSWDGFGAEFEVATDRKGRFALPLSIPCKTITTHVDITVRAYDLRRDSMSEKSRYVILRRDLQPE